MHASPVLLALHILFVVAWLGVDVGVFMSSFVIRRPGLSTETRLTVRQIMRSLDLAPRLSLILMIPTSLSLTAATGWGLRDLSQSTIWAVAVLALVWSALTVVLFRVTTPYGTAPSWASGIVVGDSSLRAIAAAFFIVTGVISLGGGGFWYVSWVAWKAIMFGAIIAMGLWIRVAVRHYHPALVELLKEGETPERLRQLNLRIRGVYPPVLLIWGTLVAMVFVATIRP